ncbi:M3 family metallopeptidase [Chitinimonas koreensis]|uniref:M3 family metallopeptidase n=1 Tax=Chitinimonas koreensis TaxID=356302 RepID=UPI0003FB4E98|nr:M3 family metallopeptidase [Chitinimonas koreensis]QNM97059.1 M3 family metallopeptidase [Chitinimonas koreensis]
MNDALRDTLAPTQPFDTNPLLADWDTPYGLPPFDRVRPEHFLPAFDVAMPAHLAELDAIASQDAAPSFDNTVVAFDGAGRLYGRIYLLFDNLCLSETSPELQAAELAMAPRLAAHDSAIYLHAGLFSRIDALYRDRAGLGLDGEQLRLLERIHLDFVRAGARLDDAAKTRYAAVTQELAELCTRFSQNVLADEAAFTLELHGEADLAGLPEFVRAAARGAAAERKLAEGSHVITLSPSLAEPFMTFSSRRDLRETIWRERVARGAHAGEHDNRPLAAAIVALRQEQAALHGYASFADYELVDRMAGKPAAVLELLEKAWQPALDKAALDRAELERRAAELGEPTPIAAWDWRYLAEKVRQQRYDLDDAELKPYFTLDNMIAAMFDCAGRLFGVSFVEQHGVPLYHPDARLWEMRDRDGKLAGLFIGDNYARPTKRSGAWMSLFRHQSSHGGGTLPIVINNNNFARAEPTLLSFDDVRTLFHEFGHGLHGLLSKVRYEKLSGTEVLQDFVELPSQIFENWAEEESVLARHARHYRTGEPIPAELLGKLRRARQFDQAWATIQYVGPALIDMALHALPRGTAVDIAAFEAEQCARLGVPADIGQRHYLSHFGHLFAGPGYAAGYYVYMWAEVLDADGYDAFVEAGDPFDAATAERLYRFIYSAGNTQDPAQAYRAFRGRDPVVEPMLKKRGLISSPV